jgi:hypothetical protein
MSTPLFRVNPEGLSTVPDTLSSLSHQLNHRCGTLLQAEFPDVHLGHPVRCLDERRVTNARRVNLH